MLENIIDAVESTICAIGSIYGSAWTVRCFIFSLLGIWTFHLTAYKILGFFFTRKFKKTDVKHKYAVCIAARNEEAVIGNLIDSIKKQDYPQDKIDIFVVADNCDDNTALVARNMGAFCCERTDSEHRTKGFALQFLFKNIEKDFGTDSYEGYFIFDADNLLKSDYITRMNEAFDAGEKVITSYRNTKNFDENWIASTYAIHWLRSIRFRHRARSVLRLATNIQGTGFLFASELVRNGWNYTSLTEDRAFTADAVAQGYPISYCDEAIFYDEQPTSLKVALRQRIRWSKGHLLAFAETGPSLFMNVLVGPRYKECAKNGINEKTRYHCKKRPDTFFARLAEQIRFRWASFDTLAQLFPTAVFKVFTWLVVSMFIHSCFYYSNPIHAELFKTTNTLGEVLTHIFGKVYIDAPAGAKAMLVSALLTFVWNSLMRINYHIKSIITPVYIFVMERKRIPKIPLYKKVLYSLTWFTFDAIGRWTTYLALFMRVEWKPIPHTSAVKIDQIEKATEEQKV